MGGQALIDQIPSCVSHCNRVGYAFLPAAVKQQLTTSRSTKDDKVHSLKGAGWLAWMQEPAPV